MRRRAPGKMIAGAVRGAALTLALAAAADPACAQDSLATAVKATYLYKFAPFVTWPAAPQAPAPFSICVVGADPFGSVLDRAVAGQQAYGRPIVVRRMGTVEHGSPCDIAFIGGSGAQSVRDALRALHGAPVLTVAEGDASPCVVDFTIDQGRVRFRIDDEAAAENGLAISSKLLSLAISINPRKAAGAKP